MPDKQLWLEEMGTTTQVGSLPRGPALLGSLPTFVATPPPAGTLSLPAVTGVCTCAQPAVSTEETPAAWEQLADGGRPPAGGGGDQALRFLRVPVKNGQIGRISNSILPS